MKRESTIKLTPAELAELDAKLDAADKEREAAESAEIETMEIEAELTPQGRKWYAGKLALLDSIHAEIAPALEAKRQLDKEAFQTGYVKGEAAESAIDLWRESERREAGQLDTSATDWNKPEAKPEAEAILMPALA